MSEEKTVLAIQSHVVHGYVGNRAATFPLQLRGWNVDALNTVNFSNNTGYGSFRGFRCTGEQVKDLYEGLKLQGIGYKSLLTGYLPSAEVVDAVAEIGRDIRKRHPDTMWLLDPVMGDEGKLYVKEDVIPAYKRILKDGLATIITPNEFEVEILTGIKLVDEKSIKAAVQFLHTEFHVPYVVISSVKIPGNKLMTVGSCANSADGSNQSKGDSGNMFTITLDRLDSYFTGTGDLFAALLLENIYTMHKQSHGFERAVSSTLVTLRQVLEKTFAYSKEHHPGGSKIADASMKYHELRLIESRFEILKPVPEEELISWQKL